MKILEQVMAMFWEIATSSTRIINTKSENVWKRKRRIGPSLKFVLNCLQFGEEKRNSFSYTGTNVREIYFNICL